MSQATAHDPMIGAQVGNYLIRSKLGEGGMGSVYLAEHPRIGKKVALKILHPELTANQEMTERFFNEARAVNDIGHPNIVDVIDYGVIPGPGGAPATVYFIMELLKGTSLAQAIETGGPMASERALGIALQIADALAASHRHRIVHRDLKPDNVILLDRGVTRDFVKVLDFGIAKLTGDRPGSRRTRTGIVMGTPAYMSPEQCEGKGHIDNRTDVYALGVVLYEMLTGRVPFEGEGYGEVLVKHLTMVPPRPTTLRGVIPLPVEAICLKALEKRPEQRFPSMDEFISALRDPSGYVEGHGGLAGFITPGLGAPGMTGPLPPEGLPPATPLPVAPPAYGTAHPTRTGPVYSPPAARSKLPLVVGLGVLAVVAGVGVVFSGGDKPTTAPAQAKAAPKAPAATPTPPVAASVEVRLTSIPPGAEVRRGDELLGTAPVTLTLPRGDAPVELRLTLAGHEERRSEVVPNKDRELEWTLRPVAAAAPTPTEAEPGGPEPAEARPERPRGHRPKVKKAEHKPEKAEPAKPARPAEKKGVGNNTLEPDF